MTTSFPIREAVAWNKGRAFVTGAQGSASRAQSVAELKKAAAGAAIMFDRGGAYPQVFAHCRDQQVHWVTYRRAPLGPRAARHHRRHLRPAGHRQVAWAEETVQLKDYGQARQMAHTCSSTAGSPCRS